LGPFVTGIELTASSEPASRQEEAFALMLSSYRILGAAERALEMSVEHTTSRVQFGKPLSSFQGVEFQLADVAVAVAGLRELAHYTTWALHAQSNASPLVEALSLRAHALDCGQRVLRTAHQLHGAIGFCDEHDLSVINRHIQPHLRLPEPIDVVCERLLGEIEVSGYDSLFSSAHTT
jgi:alkylation response protein AidB-like acyl-CoA dehydrogenase